MQAPHIIRNVAMPRIKGQHFLLSAEARTLSLRDVLRMTDDQAMMIFRAIRWASTEGEPVCPDCGCLGCYEYASRPIFKCKGCGKQFSVTSRTIFAGRKLTNRAPHIRQFSNIITPESVASRKSATSSLA